MDWSNTSERWQSLIEEGMRFSLNDEHEQALDVYQQALLLAEDKFGVDHEETSRIWNNIGAMHVSLGDLALAEQAYLRALKIDAKTYGLDHRETSFLLENLEGLYRRMGNDEVADKYESLWKAARSSSTSDRAYIQLKEELERSGYAPEQ